MPLEARFNYKGLGGPKPELIIRLVLLPRGGGNRNKARRLAERLKTDKHLGEHIRKITAGTSSVILRMPITPATWRGVNAFLSEEKSEPVDVPGQLPLAFG